MQMTDFSTADLYQPTSANNWYQSQFSTLGNSFSSFNNNLNSNNSSGHSQINSISQLHHSTSLDSVTNTLLHNSPPNSTSPQQPQSQNQLTSNNLSQTTSNNHFNHQLLSPIQQPQSLQQTRLNSNTIPLNSSNSTSASNNLNNLNTSNNTLSTFNPHSSAANTVAAVAAAAAAQLNHSHQFNLPPNLNVTAVHSAQHPTHSQFAHPLSAHHPHQHPLNHLSAHHHHSFLNAASASNNFFPVHSSNNLTGSNLTPTSSFPTPPSPSSPINNSSIHSTTNAFNNLSFNTGPNSNNTGNAMNAVAAMAAMSRNNGSLSSDNNQINAHNSLSNYERMHTGYSPFADNNSALGHSYSLIEHHSNRPSGLDSFVGLRHMSSTLTNLTSNCNSVNSSANLLMNGNNLNNSTVNNMFLPNHNSTDPNLISQSNLMANHLNSSLTNNAMLNNSNQNNLLSAHNSAHNNSINSNSDNSSRHNAEEDLTIVGIKQEDEDEQSIANNNFNNSINNSTHAMSFDWVKKSQHNIQSGKTRTRDKYRVVYSELQRVELEKEFHYSKYITIKRKTELASSLSLSERQVKIWFQNRRAKERKNDKKKEVNDCYKGPALVL